MMRKKGSWLMAIGLLCILGAAGLWTHNIIEDANVAQATVETVESLRALIPTATSPTVDPVTGLPLLSADSSPQETVIPDYILAPETPMPTQTVDGQAYLALLDIPSQNLTLPIMADWSYARLKGSPCRFTGSAYTDDLVVMAHNYSCHFGCLSDLKIGETLTLTDMNGNVFAYTVAATETLAPTAVEDMISTDWDLTLFTCTYGGGSRVTVRCEKQ